MEQTLRLPIYRQGGFTLIEIMIIVGLIGLLAVIGIPNFMKSRLEAQKQICIENLTKIDSAKQVWALETGKKNGDAVDESDLVGPDNYLKKQVICPADADNTMATSYDINTVGTPPACKIVPATHVMP